MRNRKLSKEEIIQTFEERAKKLQEKSDDEPGFLKKKIREKLLLKQQREELIAQAEGKVLEVAVGRGYNFQFYNQDTEITAVDFSPTLLGMAQQNAEQQGLNTKFIEADMEKLDYSTDSFDTIISTMTLCAYEKPVQVLNNFNKWCRSDGQILLLEHGLSSNKIIGWLINGMLNLLNDWALEKMGDNINRNILDIIRRSDIVVNNLETYYLGTHYLVEGKTEQ